MNVISEKKRALEALLFVWGSPLGIKAAADAIEVPTPVARELIEDLQREYAERGSGLMIREINGGYQFCTDPACEKYIAKLCTPVKEKRLSNAAMEVLAIIAYKQPVSRGEIEYIRGIKCDRVLEGLVKRGLVEERGKGTGLGRPALFGTTNLFLEKFGIASINELPRIEEIENIIQCGEEKIQHIEFDLKDGED
ncbi:MAG: SMC-Scp complex subunit ScpB [Firmicutes bacterium]|nr:SMC-Scp complex subunit ScpB [Bacillota bacterium]